MRIHGLTNRYLFKEYILRSSFVYDTLFADRFIIINIIIIIVLTNSTNSNIKHVRKGMCNVAVMTLSLRCVTLQDIS
jgi:hypothetical protein